MSKKILIVDDESDVRIYLSTLLTDNGYEVITADDGKQAFDLAVSENPDLICLDITMPNESGVRAYRNLHESDKTENIPVFIVTGIANDFKHFIESRKQVPPPAAYFEKPINQEEFINKVKEIIG